MKKNPAGTELILKTYFIMLIVIIVSSIFMILISIYFRLNIENYNKFFYILSISMFSCSILSSIGSLKEYIDKDYHIIKAENFLGRGFFSVGILSFFIMVVFI